MFLVEIVTLLALAQFFVFGLLVGRARGKYGVKAPAVSGEENFERVYRVQMNTLEMLVMFLPALWIASHYVSPAVVSGLGCLYLVGRLVYYQAYTSDPAKRGAGFALSALPILALIAIGLVGAIGAAFGWLAPRP